MSTLAREAAETSDAARRQLAINAPAFAALGARLRARPPCVVVTCARGSSDHASLYGKYLIETATGHVVASVGPSVASTYHTRLGLEGALVLAVSQSGQSPDLIELATTARAAGAIVVGLLNVVDSPLAHACELVIPLGAGAERAVAATKSCLLAQLAYLQLVAEWQEDAALRDALARAPDALAQAAALDWRPGLAAFTTAKSGYTVGRGIGLGAAYEAALKLKETCRLHAEGYSLAELMHGPVELVEPGFPVLAFVQHDETTAAAQEMLAHMIGLGAEVTTTVDLVGARRLPTVDDLPPVLAPLCELQSFYVALPALAAARGIDADRPRHLAKVTETR